MKIDSTALAAVRDHLDRVMYRVVDLRMSLELPPSVTGFPRYQSLQRVVGRLDPERRTLFRLLRLGEVVDDASVRRAVPDVLMDAGLVVRADGGWRTPGVLVVPAHGLLLITGIPAAYPTAPAGRPAAVYDLSTSFVAAALPGSLAGRRVLDVCSGTGIQALLCAARGASAVLGLELSASAVAIAGANAALNGLADRVRFRRSDLLSALSEDERFDFVVANLPYAPAIPTHRRPSTVDDIGNSLLWPLLDALPAHLSGSARGVLATWRSVGRAGSTGQLRAIESRLAAHGCAVSAYVDRVLDTVDGVLGLLREELGERGDAGARLDEMRALFAGAPMDGFYNQIVHFGRGAAVTASGVPAAS